MRQPIPSSQSPQMMTASPVELLEQSAERMSMGSDIGAEIRRLRDEQKRQDASRSSSRDSPPLTSLRGPLRQRSGSSLHTATRRAASSSAAPDPPPVPSINASVSEMRGLERTNTQDTYWSRPSQDSYSGRAFSFQEETIAGLKWDKPPTPPLGDALAPLAPRRRPQTPPLSPPRVALSPVQELGRRSSNQSNSSRGKRQCYQPPAYYTGRKRSSFEEGENTQQMLRAPIPTHSVDRSGSAASKSTMGKARSLFNDFDGVHYSPVAYGALEGYIPDDLDEEDEEDGEHDHSEGEKAGGDGYSKLEQEEDHTASTETYQDSSPLPSPPVETHGLEIDFDRKEDETIHEKVDILPSRQTDFRWLEPPPSENMVYYPAPVPMSLNMPKRISQHPANALSAQRKSQLLGGMPADPRKSALWQAGGKSLDNLADAKDLENDVNGQQHRHRKSVQNLTKLPPQLRADVFFNHDSIPHQIKVKDGSAVATLDSLLDASARAPADHSPEDLDLTAEVPWKSHKKVKSSALSGLFDSRSDGNRSRISLLPFKKFSTRKIPQKRRSSGGDSIIQDDVTLADEDDQNVDPHGIKQADTIMEDEVDEADETSKLNVEDEEKETKQDMPTLEEEYEAAPTTLLAELQSRKHQLRSRNKTAATAFPNGMHSTLLELDAVEQIEKKRRQTHKTNLAWEDPAAVLPGSQRNDDEDVPLAVLFPSKQGMANKQGGSDWDRPLGLLNKRQDDDSEPLSKRRNRLRGGASSRALATPQQPAAVPEEEEHSEHEGETLAQRTRRLKSTKALDDAIGTSKGGDFADDMMSQFGGLDDSKMKDQNRKEAAKALQAEGPEPEGETLGQRRRRLQAEAGAGKDKAPTAQTPIHHHTFNLTEIAPLSSGETLRQVSNESNPNGLVSTNAASEAQRKNRLTAQNQLSSSNLLTTPLITHQNRKPQPQRSTSGLLDASQLSQDNKRQQLKEQNQRATSIGLLSPLVEQQTSLASPLTPGSLDQSHRSQLEQHNQISQHKMQGVTDPLALGTRMQSQQQQQARQTASFVNGEFSGGGGAGAGAGVMQRPSFVGRPSLGSAYGVGVQQLQQAPNVMYGTMPNAMTSNTITPQQTQHRLQQLQMQMEANTLMMTEKQRSNIDRWRMSVLPD